MYVRVVPVWDAVYVVYVAYSLLGLSCSSFYIVRVGGFVLDSVCRRTKPKGASRLASFSAISSSVEAGKNSLELAAIWRITIRPPKVNLFSDKESGKNRLLFNGC